MLSRKKRRVSDISNSYCVRVIFKLTPGRAITYKKGEKHPEVGLEEKADLS